MNRTEKQLGPEGGASCRLLVKTSAQSMGRLIGYRGWLLTEGEGRRKEKGGGEGKVSSFVEVLCIPGAKLCSYSILVSTEIYIDYFLIATCSFPL